ncbi:hypothetical protein JXC34_07395 [Candidatus Woesearchaeota archaeon]|nr:hypothetical protein [Candidatus Woesearchaeota archaeon]
MKKASLNLSINAIVIFILALTLLGLALPFITGLFSQATTLTEGKFDRILAEDEKAFIEGCADDFCLEQTSFEMKKNQEQKVLMVINNKFDCTIDEAHIEIAGTDGGSSSFGSDTCNIIGGESSDQKCSDISITSFATETVLEKDKTPVDLIISVKNTAKNTVYSYKIKVYGSCVFGGQTFSFDKQKTIRVDVQG